MPGLFALLGALLLAALATRWLWRLARPQLAARATGPFSSSKLLRFMSKKLKAADLFAPLPATQRDLLPLLEPLGQQLLAQQYGDQATELTAYKTLRQQPLEVQARAVTALSGAMRVCQQHEDYTARWRVGGLLTALLRAALPLTQANVRQVFIDNGLTPDHGGSTSYYGIPVGFLLSQLERLMKRQVLEDDTRQLLENLAASSTLAYGADAAKLRVKAQALLDQAGVGAAPDALPVVRFAPEDPLGLALNDFVAHLAPTDPATRPWLALLQLWPGGGSGPQPSSKQRKALDVATAAVGAEAVRRQAARWLELLVQMPVVETPHLYVSGDYRHEYVSHDFLATPNLLAAKSLLWTVQPLADARLLQLLAAFAVRCFRKVPGRGPLAAGLGNAALHALAHSGLPGVAALAQVRPQVKQTNTQGLIASLLAEASQRLGVTADELEDLAVPDFGLDADGQATHQLGDYTATLALVGSKAELRWAKAGKPLKSAPATLKSTHAAGLKELKATQTQLQQAYATQRDRLDRGYLQSRRVAWPWFEQHYLGTGLLGRLAAPLIWRIHRPDGSHHDARRHLDGTWRDAQGQPVPAPTAADSLQLWHPVLGPVAEAQAWREHLENAQLRQPLKQAWREVYLLTPPEERTRTYSNRMAAHLLRQHQFASLARVRGWRYGLLGAYDKGYDTETASLPLPTHGLTAEFWVSEVNEDGAWNDTGIYTYVSTDQVRFVRGHREAVPLPDIDPLVFSEVMRDVDLFVGVASVGNDPTWRDQGGLTGSTYRTYWENYSFGELGEAAKNRKAVLQRLLPRLKVGRVSELTDRFLRVKGHRHTYKIHLGSGNILMEPGDRYLCIVPDRSAKDPGTDVFLPFEGDGVLSIILSKALLLMDDDKITDTTILRQL